MGEFILPYDAVRTAKNPDEALLSFLQTTYDAAATLAKWDRLALERNIHADDGQAEGRHPALKVNLIGLALVVADEWLPDDCRQRFN